MRKWGIVITAVYVCIVTVLIIPGFVRLSGYGTGIYGNWLTWAWLSIMISGQVLLLFLRVDNSKKRLKPRKRLWVSVLTTSLLTGVLFYAAAWSLLAGIIGDRVFEEPLSIVFNLESMINIFITWLVLWLIWAIIFALYARRTPHWLDNVVSWLLKGSVLELLIAVPCHLIVRHRNDCSAPGATGFGIATGIAIMLLSFGPSVLLLYQKRLQQYSGDTRSD